VGNADQARASPKSPAAQIGKGAVIEAATHADAVAVAVESDQWDQEQVQGRGEPDPARASLGLGDAKAVEAQWLTRAIAHEPEAAPRSTPQDREVGLAASARRALEQWAGVELPVGWPVGRQPPGAQEVHLASQDAGQRRTVAALLEWGERAAGPAQGAAEPGRGLAARVECWV